MVGHAPAATLVTLATSAAAAAALVGAAHVASRPPLLLPDNCAACPPALTLCLATSACSLLTWSARACVLFCRMVKRGELPEPTTAAHLAKLQPRQASGKLSEAAWRAARQDAAKARYWGQCHGGTRVWGDFDPDVYVDSNRNRFAVFCCSACRLPLPLPPAKVETSVPRTLTGVERAAIEEKRQAALARKRAHEESSPPPPPPPQLQLHTAHAPCREALGNSSDWAENGELIIRLEYQGQYWF